MSGADLGRSLAHYEALAPHYDRSTRRIDAIRLRAIAALALQPGETVLDAGCGTGWCLPHLARAVGPRGTLVAFDPSPAMLRLAAARPVGCRLHLLQATAEAVTLPMAPEAILFSYTHDLIRSEAALDHLLAQARPGARVAATSTKLYAPWLVPANWYLRWSHRHFITNFEGFAAPWSMLAARLDGFRVQTSPWSQHYVASGRVRQPR